jgi:hypothetical protein
MTIRVDRASAVGEPRPLYVITTAASFFCQARRPPREAAEAPIAVLIATLTPCVVYDPERGIVKTRLRIFLETVV